MSDPPNDGDSGARMAAMPDRRVVLQGMGIVTLGGLGLLSTVSAGRNHARTEGSTGVDRPVRDQQSGAIDVELDDGAPSLECGRDVASQFMDSDPRFADDADWPRPAGHRYQPYRFEGSADELVEFIMSVPWIREPDPDIPEDEGYAGLPLLLLFDAAENVVARHEEIGVNPGLAFIDTHLPADGEYKLVATDFDDADPEYPFALTVNCPDRAPPPDPVPGADPTPIACGETVTGELTDDDAGGGAEYYTVYDVYTFEGECGDCVTLRMRSNEGRPDLTVFTPDDSIDPSTTPKPMENETVIANYRLPQTGTYSVWASSFKGERFSYELTLECQ